MYCHSTGVPMDIRGKIRELIVASGPLMCSQYNSAWKKKFPEVQFNYQEWGFERLQACFESMPQLVVITKDDTKTWVSLTGGVQHGERCEQQGGEERDGELLHFTSFLKAACFGSPPESR